MTKQNNFNEAVENNDIEKVKSLLNDQRVDPTDSDNYALYISSTSGFVEIVDLLLKDKKINPSSYENEAIRYASDFDHIYVINLLWEDKRVKNTLKKDDLKLHDKLIQKDIKNKIEMF